METLLAIFRSSLNADYATRHEAEQQLKVYERMPDFLLSLMRLIGSAADRDTKTALSIAFKNAVRRRWVNQDDGFNPISAEEKSLIHSELINLMCSQEEIVRNQLCDAAEIITQTDYPDSWPTFWQQIQAKMAEPSMSSVSASLDLVSSFCLKYRSMKCDDTTNMGLKVVLEEAYPSLKTIFDQVFKQLEISLRTGEEVKSILRMLTNSVSIFFSINSVTIPECYEDDMVFWMDKMRVILAIPHTIDASLLKDLLELKELVIDCASLYSDKYEDEFKGEFPKFCDTIWTLVTNVDESELYDGVVVSSTLFLASVVGRNITQTFFSTSIAKLFMSVVLPNMDFRESDMDEFESDPLGFIQRDVEGSDSLTRRRSARELVEGMCRFYQKELTELCQKSIPSLLEQYAQNPPQNWKQKDLAINLVIALGYRGYTPLRGIATYHGFFSILDFLKGHVVPELQALNARVNPVVYTDCLKFLIIFRNQIPKELLVGLLSLLVPFLKSSCTIVGYYASLCIEKFLTVTDQSDIFVAQPRPRLTAQDIVVVAPDLLVSLLQNIQETQTENEFALKAIMRLVQTVPVCISNCADALLSRIGSIISEVSKNPQNPSFNHYLFEILALIIRYSSQGLISMQQIEHVTFPIYSFILTHKVSDFTPYVYQLIAFSLENKGSIDELYFSLLTELLLPESWEDRGNSYPMSRLLCCFFERCTAKMLELGALGKTVAVFQKLMMGKGREDIALSIASSLIRTVPLDVFRGHLVDILKLILLKAYHLKTNQYRIRAVEVICLASGLHGGRVVMDSINAIQPNLFLLMMQELISPIISQFFNNLKRKTMVCGIIAFIRDDCLGADQEVIGALATSLINIYSDLKPEDDQISEPEPLEHAEFSSNYSRLVNAFRPEMDPFPTQATANVLVKELFSQLVSSGLIQGADLRTRLSEFISSKS